MGKKRCRKELDEADEIEYLQKGLRQAESKGDWKEVASIHNQLGNLFRLRGDYEDAVEHHKQEGQVTRKHFKNDQISLGIAYRNIGEVFIDKKEEHTARPYIERYLKIAKNEKNLVEQQRAHITLGRICLGLIDKYTENETFDPEAASKRAEELRNAERQFQLAYEILNREEIKREVCKEKDLADMKCGTYLNLGITFDLMDKSEQALVWIQKAVTLAKHHGLFENLHRCYSSLYVTYIKSENYKECYEAAKDATKVAKQIGNKITEYESRLMEAKAQFMLNELERGVNILKRLRLQMKGNEAALCLMEELVILLTAGVRILRAEDAYFTSDKKTDSELKSHHELKGDNYVTIGNLREAIISYKNSINAAEKAGLSGKPLAALYYSLGATYKDSGDFTNALKYFRKEMEILSGNSTEEYRTQMNIADCLERAKKPSDVIIEAYKTAIRYAEGFPKKQAVSYRTLSDYYRLKGNKELADRCRSKADGICKSIGTESEEDSQDLLEEDDDPIDLSDLSAPESESDDEEQDLPRNTGIARKPVKFRKNEKGETPLHVAAIKGDIKTVRRLLAKGHEVNPRDYSGWIPLHEASNHGHYEVVVELLKHKAKVNDAGGGECDGVTPLHDAASNGHIACMRALVKHGASVITKDKSGNRPIDNLVSWYHREKDSLTDEQQEDYNDMKSSLIELMKKVGKKYTKCDEKVALRRANKRETSPKFAVMRSDTGGDDIPVTIAVLHPDEYDGKAGVNEYNEAMSFLRRKEPKSKERQPRRELTPPPKDALLTESQFVEDWLAPDENLAHDAPKHKRKRDPFEELMQADRNTRRKFEGKRNAIAQMDMVRDPVLPFDREPTPERENQTQQSEPSAASQDFDMHYPTSEPEPSDSQLSLQEINIISDDSDDELPSTSFSRKRSFGKGSSPPLSLSNKKQSKLPFTRIIRPPPTQALNDDIRILSPCKSDSGRSTSSLSRQVVRVMSQDTPLRLKIDIMGTKILVPVTQLDETIDWLCRETADRYFKECGSGMKLTVSLMTKDGCKLSGGDTVRIAISENETELIAKVENSTVIELHARFENACKKLNVEPDIEAQGALTCCETSEALVLTDIPLRGKISEALFQSLKHHLFLREINLSGSSLQDEGMRKFCAILPTLPKLDKIDLSCNGITHEGLGSFAEAFRKVSFSRTDENYKPPVGLKYLILSHNPLGNLVTEPLTLIIKTLLHLRQLVLIDCNLTAALFSKNKQGLLKSINDSNMDSLNVSWNHLKGAVTILKTEITSSRLKLEAVCCD